MVKVDLGFGLKMVKACDPGARLKMVKVPPLGSKYVFHVFHFASAKIQKTRNT